MSAGNSKRDLICEAAIRTAGRDGLLAMTLDNVAKEAGISKGGVMYHFPTKDDLVRGMLEYFGTQGEQMLMQRIADDPNPGMRWARAFISCMFPTPDDPAHNSPTFSPELIEKMMLTTVAAAVNAPEMLDPLRELGKRLKSRLMQDPKDGLEQLLVWLAVDGLLLWQFIGLIDRSDPLFAKVGEALRERIRMRTSQEVSTQPEEAPPVSA
ncbi:transcriptional regulator, TetR family [Pirellula staleyi DSM 6068]|uniref:Transcriptional regulator, TetR family n=1 Tax=Pirellula staleyi (strain ATCC 27377 / DSM 6068 / ICPB 4128) TaxID=530564 RepID=D2QWF5_PIRSD|nr:TetR/AcrR family transcriptional regulator [Pirellula staleyi]ADB17758.1 transcriptional regulator, TetR family [Pirellula staleyi DSM 6068]